MTELCKRCGMPADLSDPEVGGIFDGYHGDCEPIVNPFHGIDHWLFAIDEWHHRHARYAGQPHFPWLWWRHPLGSAWWWAWRPLCNYWEHRVGDP